MFQDPQFGPQNLDFLEDDEFALPDPLPDPSTEEDFDPFVYELALGKATQEVQGRRNEVGNSATPKFSSLFGVATKPPTFGHLASGVWGGRRRPMDEKPPEIKPVKPGERPLGSIDPGVTGGMKLPKRGLAGWLQLIGQGAIAGMATPNVGEGGPMDIARSAMAGMGVVQQQQDRQLERQELLRNRMLQEEDRKLKLENERKRAEAYEIISKARALYYAERERQMKAAQGKPKIHQLGDKLVQEVVNEDGSIGYKVLYTPEEKSKSPWQRDVQSDGTVIWTNTETQEVKVDRTGYFPKSGGVQTPHYMTRTETDPTGKKQTVTQSVVMPWQINKFDEESRDFDSLVPPYEGVEQLIPGPLTQGIRLPGMEAPLPPRPIDISRSTRYLRDPQPYNPPIAPTRENKAMVFLGDPNVLRLSLKEQRELAINTPGLEPHVRAEIVENLDRRINQRGAGTIVEQMEEKERQRKGGRGGAATQPKADNKKQPTTTSTSSTSTPKLARNPTTNEYMIQLADGKWVPAVKKGNTWVAK